MTRYAIVDLDLSGPLPEVRLGADEHGVALVLRRYGLPVGFVMEERVPGETLSAAWLASRAAAAVPADVLARPAPEVAAAEAFPALSVIVCTRAHPDLLGRCLGALAAMRGAGGSLAAAPFETLVVDNAPPDHGTRAVAASRPGVRYVCEPMPGLDFARNRAIEEATGELLAFIDDDVVVDAGWLEGLQRAWAAHPDAGAFTGQVLPYELATRAQILIERVGGFRRGFQTHRYGETSAEDPLHPCTTVFGNGCNMTFRRDVLLQLGGFDEALDTGAPLPGGGDLDMLYRVVRAGYPLVYEPAALVFHQHRREYARLRAQICWSWGTGCMAFLVKVYRYDPEQRWKAARFARWWLRDLLHRLARSLVGRHELPPDLVIAELWGALAGLLGGYGRSRRRAERIRRQHDRVPPAWAAMP